MSTGAWVALAAVALAVAVGGYRLLTDGRFRTRPEEQTQVEPTGEPSAWDHLGPAVGGVPLGERATLVQFSTAFCAPCRVTRRTLGEVAAVVPGVTHVEVDAEHHLEVVRRLGVLRTPTTLVLDAQGREVTRAAGAPRKEQVLAAIGGALPD